MKKDTKFILPEDFHQREFIEEVLYCIQQEKTCRKHYVYYDTFDWRLYNKSLVLCSTAQTLLLQSLDETTVLARATMTVPPVFLSDFPGAACRRKSPRSLKCGPSSNCSPWRPNVPLYAS